MNKKLLPAVFALASSLTVVGSAHAATVSSTLDVTAIVGQVCTVSTSPVVFNVVDQFVDTFANGGINVTCNPGMPYNITLDAGLHFNFVRNVANGAILLQYDLFSNPLVQPWGDDFATVPAPGVFSTASGGADQFTVYGVLWGGQPIVPDGVYSDVVGVTVFY